MSTTDGGRSAVDNDDGEDCPGDKAADDDGRLHSRLGRFTIGDNMSDVSASAKRRLSIYDSKLVNN